MKHVLWMRVDLDLGNPNLKLLNDVFDSILPVAVRKRGREVAVTRYCKVAPYLAMTSVPYSQSG